MKILTVLLFSMLVAPAFGADAGKPSPALAYRGIVNSGILTCSQQVIEAMQIAEIKRKGIERYDLPEPMAPDWQACVVEQKAQAKVSYETALKTVKKPAARAALKEHFVAVFSALSGLAPYNDELKLAYTKRQGENTIKLRELWDRFEIEN